MAAKKKTQFFYNDALISKSHQESGFRAVKDLVQAENNIEMIKNRVKVLQLNEQRNLNKINAQKQQIQKITLARNEHLDQLRKLGVSKNQRERMVEEMKNKNDQFRKQHHHKIQTIKEETYQEKSKEHTQALELRQLHESVILQSKTNSLHQKQEKRNFVAQNQQKSKQNIIKFYEDKTKQIYEKNMFEIKKIHRSRQKKQKQLSQLSNIEMVLIQRHSESQVAYKEMKSKLDNMLGKIRSEKRKGLKQMKSSVHRDGKENMYSLDGV